MRPVLKLDDDLRIVHADDLAERASRGAVEVICRRVGRADGVEFADFKEVVSLLRGGRLFGGCLCFVGVFRSFIMYILIP